MPRKPSVTKEAMLDAAFRLVRREGHGALTARSLATELGCSTQPVMYQFPTLLELREEVYRRADAFHTEYILAGDDLLGVGVRYVRFAAEEPALFKLLFQSGHFDGASLRDLIRTPEATQLLGAVGPTGAMGPELAAQHFETLYVAAHGYASLVANNAMEFDERAVEGTLRKIGEALLSDGSGEC